MNELKFRAYDTITKKMMFFDLNDIAYDFDCGYLVGFILDFNPLLETSVRMQYTGLKDKNGKEIYEGDIIESIENGMRYLIHDIFPLSRFPQYHSSTPLSRNIDGEVISSNGIRENYSDDWVSNPEFYKVIGDQFTNSELLKEAL